MSSQRKQRNNQTRKIKKNTAISFSENPIILITVDYIFASQWFSIRSAFSRVDRKPTDVNYI